MQINITYDDQAQNNAPAAFQGAVDYVVNLFDATFTNNVQVNIEVGWAEFYNGFSHVALNSGALGTNYDSSHLDLGSGIVTNTAEQKALGQKDPNDSGTDGWAGFSDGTNGGLEKPGVAFGWSYTAALPNTTLPAGTYYLIGVIEHEFSEVMGRVSNPEYAPYGTFSSPMDAFRLEGGGPAGAYYSVDGNTNWGQWNNNPANGDLGDWLNTGGQPPSPYNNDAFGSANPGAPSALTTTDINLMNHLGWTTAPTGTITDGVTGYLSPTISNDISQFVSSGGSIVVQSGGYLEVMSGFTVGTVFVSSGGTMQVDSGGTANVTQVSSAILTVSAGGVVNNTIVDTGAVNVYGSAFGTTLNSDQFGIAGLTIRAGGTAAQTDVQAHSNLTVYGSATDTFVGGTESFAYVEGGGSVSGTNVDDGGVLTISALGSASGTVINSGGYETISSGGTDSGATVSSGGIQSVSGLAVGATLTGEQDINVGGTASGTIFAGGTQNDNGLVKNEKLNDGILNVQGFATADSVDVQAGGTLNIFYASKLTNVSFDGGTENVEASVIDTGELFNGGTQNVLSGATASLTEVLNGAVQEVFSGGAASGTIVGNIAYQTIDAGGKAVAATVKVGGLQQAFGEADGTIVDGDQEVEAGGNASGSDVQNGGVEDVFGTDLDAHVESGGHQAVDVGGSATSASVDGGGLQTVSAGGFTTGTQLNGGEEDVYGSAFQTRIDNGGTENVYGHDDSANIVQGTQTVETGGVVSATTIGANGSQTVSGTGEGATVLAGGVQEVASVGTALGTKIDVSGQQNVDHGGFAIAASIAGNQDIHGEADGGIVSVGGKQTVESDGVASGTTVDGKQVDNGTALNVTVDFGGEQDVGGNASGGTVSGLQMIGLLGVASGTTVYNGGKQEVTQGGSAVGTIIDSGGGVQQVDVFGFAGGTIIEGGEQDVLGSATGTMVRGGKQLVESGGKVSGTTISAGASEVVASGGTTSNTTIDGGTLVLSAGAVASGSITFGTAGGELQTFGKTMPKATISGLAAGDTIDLADVKFKAGGSATVGAGNVATITEGGHSYALKLDPKKSFVGLGFVLAADGASGTVIDLVQQPLSGSASVSAGQTATAVQVVSGGFLDVLSGGATVGTTVSSSGVEQVEGGGSASGTIVDSGGRQNVRGAATSSQLFTGVASGTAVNTGGLQDVMSGGTAVSATLSGSSIFNANLQAHQTVESGGKASGTIIDYAGVQTVSSGGSVTGTTVNAGGEQDVYGVAKSTTVIDANQFDYGTASGTSVDGGTQAVENGGTAVGTTVYSDRIGGGQQIVYGTASSTTIGSRGHQDVYGSAVGTVVESGGTEFPLGPFAVTTNTVINGGQEIVNAGTALATTISAGLMELASGASIGSKPVTFAGSGTLKLDASVSFSGKIQGFGASAVLDLADIAFGSKTTVAFKENAANTGGTLTVSDGVHVAKLSLIGQYSASQFTKGPDSGTGTLIGDPSAAAALTTSMTSPGA
jgi:autotransporter passenger strand-loop-strand repeat protein